MLLLHRPQASAYLMRRGEARLGAGLVRGCWIRATGLARPSRSSCLSDAGGVGARRNQSNPQPLVQPFKGAIGAASRAASQKEL